MSLAVAALLSPGVAGSGRAADKNVKTTKPAVVALSSEQEQRALEFAREHHPELAELLDGLQKRSQSGFSKGVRDIHTAVVRLERVRERQPARFETELNNWKLDSEIRLLTARWSMSQDPELEKQIRERLRQRRENRIDQLKSEREKLVARLAQLDNQIGMGAAELEVELAAEWDRLAKRATTTAKAQQGSRKTRNSEEQK
ncbi:MAG: hypothetical protein R3C59_15690 [Planctomycetaceae bacterium]